MLRSIYYRLPPKSRRLARRSFFLPVDLWKKVFGERKQLVPPKGLSFVGRGDFVKVGDKFAKHIIDVCEIKEDAKILDIGCGIGRISRPFTRFLNNKGEFIGFDIIDDGVKWCKARYSDFSNFKFEYYPLKNDLYNLSVDNSASNFSFPYEDNYFDLCLSISVFTHMQKEEVENYFAQVSRVLKPGARCYATFFVAEEEKDFEMFPFVFDNYCLHNSKVKDANVAFYKSYLELLAKKNNLIIEKEFSGWWKSNNIEGSEDYQDIFIIKKQV